MNLLEKAMRQKAMRESLSARKDDRDLSYCDPSHTPRPATNRSLRRLLITAGTVISLSAATIAILFDPTPNLLSATLPRQDMPQQSALVTSPQNKENDKRQEVRDFVESWVRAWSAKDVGKYLSAYAPEFKPAQGLTRSAWEKQRRQRLAKYKKIEITLANLSISVEKNTATVDFIQSFKADDFSETGLHKKLELKLHDSRWMITGETSR